MKILCISDHIDPVVYSHRIKKRFSDIDFVISCGDLRLNYYDYIITNLNKPLFFVFGNHHLKHFEAYHGSKVSSPYFYENKAYLVQNTGATYVEGKSVIQKNMIIMGFGGCMWYNGGENQFTEIGMFLRILKKLPRLLWNKLIHKRFVDILLTHAPPRGIHDQEDPCHRGFKAFNWFIKMFKPKYMVHGHIHLYDKNANRIDRVHSTDVINAFDHHVLEINNSNDERS